MCTYIFLCRNWNIRCYIHYRDEILIFERNSIFICAEKSRSESNFNSLEFSADSPSFEMNSLHHVWNFCLSKAISTLFMKNILNFSVSSIYLRCTLSSFPFDSNSWIHQSVPYDCCFLTVLSCLTLWPTFVVISCTHLKPFLSFSEN